MSRIDLNAYFKTAIEMHRSGKLKEARRLYFEILKLKPNHPESWLMIGQTFYSEKKYKDAIESYDKGLSAHPDHPDLLIEKGKTLLKLGRPQESKVLFEKLVKSDNPHPKVLFQMARNMKELGQFEEAVSYYEQLLKVDPNHKQGLNNLGNLYQQMYDYKQSMKCYDQLIAIDSGFSMAYCNKAGLLQKLGQNDEAEKYYYKALAVDKSNSLAYFNLGVIENLRFDADKSQQFLNEAIRLDPENPKYLSAYAITLDAQGKKEEAITLLKNLIQSGTKSEDPYLKLAKLLLKNSEHRKVADLLENYVKLNPYSWESLYLLGAVYDSLNHFEKAEKFLTTLKKHPEYALRSKMTLQFLYSKTGKVEKYHEMMQEVTHQLQGFVDGDRQEEEIPVYNLAYYPFDPELIRKATHKYSQGLIKGITPLRQKLNFNYHPGREKIRIGYLSPYFKMHPAGTLILDVLKNHDRNKFEIFAYGINCGDDALNKKIRPLTDKYTDVGQMRVDEAAKLINKDEITILVSLAGYNYGMKNEIPALKPAPIQVICLDCHETMQVDYYDYMFKDRVVITEENRKFFNESIAFLPPSHFFNAKLFPAEKVLTKADYGIPEEVFVFGSLNHPRKTNPQTLRAWFHILNQTPHSILWLYDAGLAEFRENIASFASKNGLDAKRIIFCGKESHDIHLKRMELIDLFLDTAIYNGHTTCLEALWMSVPVLTWRGASVSSRLCSSFLVALEMREMISEDEDQYIAKAVRLATHQEEWSDMKNRLIEAKNSHPFFAPAYLTRNMESAYEHMWDRYEKGLNPQDFEIV